jgi:hypothetical protein
MDQSTCVLRNHTYIILCVLIVFAAGALGVNGCKDSSLPSAPTKPREYSWRMDTIYVPGSYYTRMGSVWGFSTGDVYIAGDTPLYPGRIWHFDGAKWKPVPLWIDEGGQIATRTGLISSLHGKPDGALYAAGSTGSLTAYLICYRNGRWVDISPDSTRLLASVFASDGSDVWVGGINGALFHFDDRTFKFTAQTLPLNIPPDANPFWLCSSIAAGRGNTPALLVYMVQLSKYYMLEYEGGSWAVFDSTDWGRERLWYSPEGTLWAVGYGVHKRRGDTWESMYPELYVHGITGTSDNNLFVVGRYGTTARIFHFDGIDWYLYDQVQVPDAIFYDCWTDGIALFVVGALDGFPTKSIVLQGQ